MKMLLTSELLQHSWSYITFSPPV